MAGDDKKSSLRDFVSHLVSAFSSIVFYVLVSVTSIFIYHQYLISKGYIGDCVKKIYTIDYARYGDMIKQEISLRMSHGEKIDPDMINKILEAFDSEVLKEASKLPAGSVVFPKSAVVYGSTGELVINLNKVFKEAGLYSSSSAETSSMSGAGLSGKLSEKNFFSKNKKK